MFREDPKTFMREMTTQLAVLIPTAMACAFNLTTEIVGSQAVWGEIAHIQEQIVITLDTSDNTTDDDSSK